LRVAGFVGGLVGWHCSRRRERRVWHASAAVNSGRGNNPLLSSIGQTLVAVRRHHRPLATAMPAERQSPRRAAVTVPIVDENAMNLIVGSSPTRRSAAWLDGRAWITKLSGDSSRRASRFSSFSGHVPLHNCLCRCCLVLSLLLSPMRLSVWCPPQDPLFPDVRLSDVSWSSTATP